MEGWIGSDFSCFFIFVSNLLEVRVLMFCSSVIVFCIVIFRGGLSVFKINFVICLWGLYSFIWLMNSNKNINFVIRGYCRENNFISIKDR